MERLLKLELSRYHLFTIKSIYLLVTLFFCSISDCFVFFNVHKNDLFCFNTYGRLAVVFLTSFFCFFSLHPYFMSLLHAPYATLYKTLFIISTTMLHLEKHKHTHTHTYACPRSGTFGYRANGSLVVSITTNHHCYSYCYPIHLHWAHRAVELRLSK